jgi:hypothetical protein
VVRLTADAGERTGAGEFTGLPLSGRKYGAFIFQATVILLRHSRENPETLER